MSAAVETWAEDALAGAVGGPGTRLLAGPAAAHGPEPLAAHDARLGRLALGDPAGLREQVRRSGLTGRGGGEFPLARKLDAAAAGAGPPLVVVNGSEGEPASRKDRTLVGLRPHLVLDGAVAAAAAVGADRVVVYVHRAYRDAWRAVHTALAERCGRDHVSIDVVDAPRTYVAGESAAVVSVLSGDGVRPGRRAAPVAVRGVGGRPTVVSNAETLGHLALLARYGAEWFRTAGSPDAPGSTLVTLAGAVAEPGRVVEVRTPMRMGDLLAAHAGVTTTPRAVLVGGYAGTWVDGRSALELPVNRAQLRAAGVRLGCGLLAVIDERTCGLVETLRLLRYLAGESSGQCGPCVFGLPRLADQMAAAVAGVGSVRRVHELAVTVNGRGACAHPDGAVALADSALRVFAAELRRHRWGRSCRGRRCRDSALLPLPAQLEPVR